MAVPPSGGPHHRLRLLTLEFHVVDGAGVGLRRLDDLVVGAAP